MNEKALMMFQREVERQCWFALMAHDDLHEALREDDMRRVWFSVQALLVALGNVSKLLWPIKGRGDAERGDRLRETLSVDADSPLRLIRIVRDHFEHFDERLDEWALDEWARTSENLDYADSNVGISPGKGVEYWFADSEYLRNIYRTDYPRIFAIAFRGEDFDLLPVIEAVRELEDRAADASRDLP